VTLHQPPFFSLFFFFLPFRGTPTMGGIIIVIAFSLSSLSPSFCVRCWRSRRLITKIVRRPFSSLSPFLFRLGRWCGRYQEGRPVLDSPSLFFFPYTVFIRTRLFLGKMKRRPRGWLARFSLFLSFSSSLAMWGNKYGFMWLKRLQRYAFYFSPPLPS